MKKAILMNVLCPIFIGIAIYAIKPCLYNVHLPKFIFNQVPDFLWMFASLNSLSFVWKSNSVELKIYMTAMLLLAILLEIFQKLKFVPGTFDWYDIVAYLLAFSLCLILINKLTFKTFRYENKN